MNALLYAALGTGFTFLMTALGASAVFFVPKQSRGGSKRLCLGFAAGVMVAATVWSLLIPALEHEKGGMLPSVCGIVLGALVLVGLENVMERPRPTAHLPQALHALDGSSKLLFAAVTLHNIPEGIAVGLSFALAAHSGQPALLLAACSLALGIGIQNLPEGTALSLPLHEQGLSKRHAVGLSAASAVVEPVFGVLAVLAVSAAQPLLPWLLAFAAGAMLVVSVRELIPQACCGDERYVGTLSVLAGFVLMMLLDVALG